MKFFRMPGKLLIRVLCILLVLLLLTGCSSSDTQPLPAETAIPPEVLTAELMHQELYTGSTCDHPDEIIIPEESATADSTENVEETGATQPPEPSPDVIAAQQENRLLQDELDALAQQQEKSKQIIIMIAVLAAMMLITAILFLYLWHSAVSALKRARKKQYQPAASTVISQIKVGKVHGIGCRSNQQDSFSVSPEDLYSHNGLLAVVADGMGGLEDGDKASQTAVLSAMESFFSISGTGTERLLQILAIAKRSVDALKADAENCDCGTTMIMSLVQDGHFHFVSVGDSRICLYRSGTLIQLNREHSCLFDQVRKAVNGEISFDDALSDAKNGCITSYLGMQHIQHIDIPGSPIALLPKDKLILMSDGVSNALTEHELCLALQHSAQDAADAIDSFIRTKNFPDQDNYTAVILECR